MAKKILTPGKLYAKLAAEFRRLRPTECQSCAMPMLYIVENPAEDEANWAVQSLDRLCEGCEPVVADIVRRYSLECEVYDPVFTTRPAKSFFGASSTIPPFQPHGP